MTKNPLINAAVASGYIVLIVSLMNFVSQTLRNKPDTFFAPVAFISILTFSVAVMAYVFFYQPIQLFISGKKKESVNLFIKTVGIFGIITAVVAVLLLLRVI